MRISRFSLVTQLTADSTENIKTENAITRPKIETSKVNRFRKSNVKGVVQNDDLESISKVNVKSNLKNVSKIKGKLNEITKLKCHYKNDSKYELNELNLISDDRSKDGYMKNVANDLEQKKNDKQNDDYNLPRILAIPERVTSHCKHLHRQRKKHRFNKLSSIFVSSLSSGLDKNNHLKNVSKSELLQSNDSIQTVNLKNVNLSTDQLSHLETVDLVRKYNRTVSNIESSANDKNAKINLNDVSNENVTFQPYLLTNSLIKLHRKVKRRKINHNGHYSTDAKSKKKFKRRNYLNEKFSNKQNRRIKNQFSNQANSTLKTFYLTLTLFNTYSTDSTKIFQLNVAQPNKSLNVPHDSLNGQLNTSQLTDSSFDLLNESRKKININLNVDLENGIYRDNISHYSQHYIQKTTNLPLSNNCDENIYCTTNSTGIVNLPNFSSEALAFKSPIESIENLPANPIDILEAKNVSKYNLNSLSQVSLDKATNESKNVTSSVDTRTIRFAQNLMLLIYFILIISVIILLLRVIYIAIVRKLRRPLHGTASQSQNSARHSSQLYTQNTFNPSNFGYHQSGGTNSNSNVNVSTYGGRSEANSISGGTTSHVGPALATTLVAHNIDCKTERINDHLAEQKKNAESVVERDMSHDRIQSPTNLISTINRPFSRQSGKFTDLNIVSDEFSSSVYANEDEHPI